MLKRFPSSIREIKKSFSGRLDSSSKLAKKSSFVGISFHTLRNITKPSEFQSAQNPPPEQACTKKLYKRFKSVQKVIYTILEDPSSSPIAKIIFMIIVFAILFTTIDSIISTTSDDSPAAVIQNLEIAVSAIFITEYCFRIFSATAFQENFFHVMLRPFNIIDLIAIVPFFIELGFLESTQTITVLKTLRIVRLARIVRILKIGRYLKGVEIFFEGVKASLSSLGFLIFLIILGDLIFATAFYFAESFDLSQMEIDAPVRVQSIPQSMWWAIVTITTVGYGDYIPVTLIGKIIASFVAVLGMLMIALPVAILGVNFQHTFTMHAESERADELRGDILKSHPDMDESQKEIYFMNARIGLIDERNKSIIKLLADSESEYKKVARDLRHMYRSIYVDEKKFEEEEQAHEQEQLNKEHHETPNNHDVNHSSKISAVASKLEMRIKLYEKINRAKKKISAANIFQKFKKGPGGTKSSFADAGGATEKSLDASNTHPDLKEEIISELPELKSTKSKVNQMAMKIPFIDKNSSKFQKLDEEGAEYVETDRPPAELIEIPVLETTIHMNHGNTYKSLYEEYRRKNDYIEDSNYHHQELNYSLRDKEKNERKFGIKSHTDHGENNFLRYYIENLQFVSQSLFDELMDTNADEGDSFSYSSSYSESEDNQEEKNADKNKPGHVVPNKLTEDKSTQSGNMRRRGSLDSNCKIIIPNIQKIAEKQKEKAEKHHHHGHHHHHEHHHHSNHHHEHGHHSSHHEGHDHHSKHEDEHGHHSNHHHQHHSHKNNEHGERIPKNFDPKTWELTGKILESIEAKKQFGQLQKLQEEIATDKQKGRKKKRAFTQVKSDSQKMKEFLKVEHQVKVNEWIKSYKEDMSIDKKISQELHLHKIQRAKNRLNHHHGSENKETSFSRINEHAELLPEIKEADEEETALTQSDKVSFKSRLALNSILTKDK